MEHIKQILNAKRITASNADSQSEEELKKLKSLFMATAHEYIQKSNPGKIFEVDERNMEIIQGLWSYFMGFPGIYDPNRGLYIVGPPGTGKSLLLYVFSSFMRKLRKGFKVYTANDIAIQFEQTGDLDLFTANTSGYLGVPVNLAIDEIGHEPRPSVHFGTKRNVIQYILHSRYTYWQQTGLKTYITTNLDMDDIEAYYGDAIRDRIPQMFNIIPIEGASRRS